MLLAPFRISFRYDAKPLQTTVIALGQFTLQTRGQADERDGHPQ